MKQLVYIGADHRGFAAKEQLKEYLAQQGFSVTDLGAHSYDSTDDYTDFAFAVADAVAKDLQSIGIVLCGSGVGVAVAANKIAGVRCVLAASAKQAQHAREYDNCNVLALAADYLSKVELDAVVKSFVSAEFKAEPRMLRRLQKIEERE